MKKITAVLVSVAVLAGCASVGNERLKDQSQATIQQQFTEGTTTKAQVLAVLGNANKVTFTDAGNEVWVYRWAHSTPQVRNFIPVVGLISRGHDVRSKELVIMFNQSGIVSRYSMNESDDVVNRGLVH